MIVEILTFKTIFKIRYKLFLEYFSIEEKLGDGSTEVEKLGKAEDPEKAKKDF